MKNKLGILISILIVLVVAFLYVILFISPDVQKKEKVTVYVFSASGCPFCEEQMTYLKNLDTYGKEFTIVEKELYIDHISWEKGKDYDLAKKVETEMSTILNGVVIDGTPFVIVENIYAKTGLNTNLEDYIHRAYLRGTQVDVVKCLEENGTNCVKEKETNKEKDYLPVRIIETITIIAGIGLITGFVYILKKK